MNLNNIKQLLPKTDKNVIVILSGGLDSSALTMILSHHYGANRLLAISFDYGQKQNIELEKASTLCEHLNVQHQVLNLSILGEIARPFSANISGTDILMPSIKDVLGEPQPVTYVPNRNMIMYSLAASIAEVKGAEYIFCGIQIHDQYGYWDTTQEWVDRMNHIFTLNRKNPITLSAPLAHLSKFDEIKLIQELGLEHYFRYTLTCYNPNIKGESCGQCPSCSERIAAFMQAGIKDPISYSVEIKW